MYAEQQLTQDPYFTARERESPIYQTLGKIFLLYPTDKQEEQKNRDIYKK